MVKNKKELYFYSTLKEERKQKKQTFLKILRDDNGFVRIDPRYLTNI